jgi:hypothetical protein
VQSSCQIRCAVSPRRSISAISVRNGSQALGGLV